jgi:hypothetical protein
VKRRRLWILAAAFGIGSIAAWALGSDFLDHMRGLCGKRCVPSAEDWAYFLAAFAFPPLGAILFLTLGWRAPRG